MEIQTCVEDVSGQNCRVQRQPAMAHLSVSSASVFLVSESTSLLGRPFSSRFLPHSYFNALNCVPSPLSPGLHCIEADFLDNVNHSIVLIKADTDQWDDLVGNSTCHQA